MKLGSVLLIGACTVVLALSGCGKDDKKGDDNDDEASGTTGSDTVHELDTSVRFCGSEPCPCDSQENHDGTELPRTCKVNKPTSIQGVPLKRFANVEFNRDGQLVRFIPHGHVKIGPYLASGAGWVRLYDDSSPMQLTLGDDVAVGGTDYKKGQELCFDSAGKTTDCSKLGAD